MALPRTKREIEVSWHAWLQDYAETNGMSDELRGETRVALAAEIHWMTFNLNFEQDLQRRIDKTTAMLANEVDPSTFDIFWQARRDLFLWMQS